MDLKSYLAIIKGNKWIILATVIATVAVVGVLTYLTTPIYTASTTVRVATAASGSVGYYDYMYADRLMNTYIRLATSSPILAELRTKLNITTTPEVSVETISNTELIRISVEGSDPALAQNAANTLAEILVVRGKELYSGGDKSSVEILREQMQQAESELAQDRKDYEAYMSQHRDDTAGLAAMSDAITLKERTYSTLLEQYDQARLRESFQENTITIVEPATLPTIPTKPNKVMNIAVGLAIGLVGGLGLAFFFENFNSRLYSSKDIEALVAFNTIGKIPSISRKHLLRIKKLNDDIVALPFKDSFRRLNQQIQMRGVSQSDNGPIKTVLITSSEPGEGKSTIAKNLAITVAQSGKRVILVDCDMHLPKQHKINGLPNLVGLSNLLAKTDNKFNGAIQSTRQARMHILTSGPIPTNAANLLESGEMSSLVKWLSEQYDMVILDSPAFLAVVDTSILVPMVDGIVFVARRNTIGADPLMEACKQLTDMNANVIGLVINDAEHNGNYYYYGHK